MRRLQLGLGLLVSALFLWLALGSLDLTRMGEALQSARYGWLVPAVLTYFITVGARAWRWTYLLRPLRVVRAGHLFPVVVIGYLGNNIYPFRVGEVLRAYLLRRREGVSMGGSLATILVERVFDGLAVLTIVFVALLLAPPAGATLGALLVLASVIFFGALAFSLILATRPRLAIRLIDYALRLLPGALRPRLAGFGQRFLSGLAALRDWRTVLTLFFSSLLIWLVETAKYWLVMQAFPFSVSWPALMLTNGVVNLVTVIPSAPGYVGTFDAPAIAMLALYGVPQALAGAYTLVLHATLWLPSTLVGFVYMMREGLSWSDFGRAAQAEAATPPAP